MDEPIVKLSAWWGHFISNFDRGVPIESQDPTPFQKHLSPLSRQKLNENIYSHRRKTIYMYTQFIASWEY